MTLQEIRDSDKVFLTPFEISEALGTDPQNIRNQAAIDAAKLGFPVIRIGTRTKIPREAFLKYIEGATP